LSTLFLSDREPVPQYIVESKWMQQLADIGFSGISHYQTSVFQRQLLPGVTAEAFVENFLKYVDKTATKYRYFNKNSGKHRTGSLILIKSSLMLKFQFSYTDPNADEDEGEDEYKGDEASVGVDVYINGFGDSALGDEIMDLVRTMTKEPKAPLGTVYMLMSGAAGYSFSPLPNRITNEFERENYSPKVLDGFERISKDLQSNTPHGKIGIFDGEPGTGKTHLLRGLLRTVEDTVFVFVAPSDLTAMTGATILPALIDFKRMRASNSSITFLIEDADECLAPRMGDNMSSISSVLNLGDGILGQLLDIRLVMTTNAKHKDFDPAITRPGRLSACVSVGRVDTEQANAIYKRLMNKDGEFTDPKTLAEIYQLAFDSGYTPVSNKGTMGFQSAPLPHSTVRKIIHLDSENPLRVSEREAITTLNGAFQQMVKNDPHYAQKLLKP
jgi:hypothetical protein